MTNREKLEKLLRENRRLKQLVTTKTRNAKSRLNEASDDTALDELDFGEAYDEAAEILEKLFMKT